MRNPAPELLDATLGRILFESSLDGVVVVDARGQLVEANAAALAMPFARIEPLLVERDTPDAELFAFHEQLQVRGRASTEVRVRSSCGQLRHIVVEGRAIGSRRLFLLRDVTQLRATQEEVHAVRRLEALGRFTATLAHDLNNVLAPIGGLSQMLSQELGAGTSGAELANDVAGLARTGADLVRCVVSFARGEPGKRSVVDLTSHLERLQPMLRRLVGTGIEVTLTAERAPTNVEIDSVMFDHVMLNLLANARDAIQERGMRGTITIRTANVLVGFTESELPPGLTRGRYVMLTVTDDGAGMNEAVRERALEPFFSTKCERSGLGLGLANARRFAVENGGGIAVRSEPGEGTTVTLHLPRID